MVPTANHTETLVLEEANDVIALIHDIFKRHGAESYLGEDVTMAEHMLQGAALAVEAGLDDEVVIGALLHDIGHYVEEFPDADMLKEDRRHQETGATVLERWFPPRTVACVRQHVAAKRYLCAVEREYFEGLSDASVHTLGLQGGPMEPAECEAFEQTVPFLEDVLAVRRFDDAGKVAGRMVPPFEHYLPMLRALVRAHSPNAR